MKVLYTSTLCVSAEKSPTCGQILTIIKKLKAHLTVQDGDTVFISNIKKRVWENLSKRYQVSYWGRQMKKCILLHELMKNLCLWLPQKFPQNVFCRMMRSGNFCKWPLHWIRALSTSWMMTPSGTRSRDC